MDIVRDIKDSMTEIIEADESVQAKADALTATYVDAVKSSVRLGAIKGMKVGAALAFPVGIAVGAALLWFLHVCPVGV